MVCLSLLELQLPDVLLYLQVLHTTDIQRSSPGRPAIFAPKFLGKLRQSAPRASSLLAVAVFAFNVGASFPRLPTFEKGA